MRFTRQAKADVSNALHALVFGFFPLGSGFWGSAGFSASTAAVASLSPRRKDLSVSWRPEDLKE